MESMLANREEIILEFAAPANLKKKRVKKEFFTDVMQARYKFSF